MAAEPKRNMFSRSVDVTHIDKMLRWGRTDDGRDIFCDEGVFGGDGSAPEPLQYFTAATGF